MATSILGQLLFEKKPILPTLEPIDLATEQGKAVKGNLGVLPQAEKLATQVNQFNQDALTSALRKTIPGYDELVGQTSKVIGSELKGEIPQSVQDQLQNKAAAQALAGGYGAGSGMGRNLQARDFGLASLDITNRALSSVNSWLATGRQLLTAPQMDVTSAFVSPMQQAQFDVQERNTMWNYNWFKNQLAAQPEPWQKAVEGLLNWIATTGESIAGSYAGNLNAGQAASAPNGGGQSFGGFNAMGGGGSFGGYGGEASAGQGGSFLSGFGNLGGFSGE